MFLGKIKYLVLGLGVAIIILFGVLIFVPSVHSPVVPASPTSTTPDVSGPALSPDGHVEVGAPLADELVSSPLRLAGNVIGGAGWVFEGSFPIKVLDGDGRVLGLGIAHAIGEWASTDTLPFSAVISFTPPRFATGTIVLSKDNPSGLPQNNASFNVPIRFAKARVIKPPAPTSTLPVFKNDSGVRGIVTLSPTCPVERFPPDPACAPKPYQDSISISRSSEAPAVFMTIKSNASGTFSVALPPGEYMFHPFNGSAYPRCSELLITVASHTFSNVTLMCDTGIR